MAGCYGNSAEDRAREHELNVYLDSFKDDDNYQYEVDQVTALLDYTPNLHDYMEETELLASEVNVILADDEDDKLGRIKDVFNKAKSRAVDFVMDNHENCEYADFVLQEALK